MANVCKFNRDEVLEKICHVFWRKGYAATTMDDLVEASGVKRQSLYNAYGNKREMFLKSYASYTAMITRRLDRVLQTQGENLSDNIRKILEMFARVVIDTQSPSGCFVTNTAIEFGEQSRNPIMRRLRKDLRMIEDNLFATLSNAQADGQIANDRDPRSIAQLLVASVPAIAVMYRLNKNKQFTRNVIDEILRVLD